jgi:hypothetical protein
MKNHYTFETKHSSVKLPESLNLFLNHKLCAFTLTPTNKKTVEILERETGHSSILFQTDWDYPFWARLLGWNGKVGWERCSHNSTDGTVNCKECGLAAFQFISAAGEWLDNHCNQVFRMKTVDFMDYKQD